MQLGSMFISNCNNAIHVSDAFFVHPQQHLDTSLGYFTPSHVINQRMLLQFLSAPEDERKKSVRNM